MNPISKNLISLKTLFYQFLVLTIVESCFYSCQEKKTSEDNSDLFLEKSANFSLEDSSQVYLEFNTELNLETEKDRGSWQNPDLVIDKLGEISGKIVADIGSGTGYFTFPISKDAKRVLAIDIEQRYLDYIEDRKLELPIDQADVIETRLTVENEPNLHSDEVDAILMVNVYYYLNDKFAYMNIVNNALRNDGVLVLVDFKQGTLPVGPSGKKNSPGEVMKNLKSAGFLDIILDTASLQYQYIITAK